MFAVKSSAFAAGFFLAVFVIVLVFTGLSLVLALVIASLAGTAVAVYLRTVFTTIRERTIGPEDSWKLDVAPVNLWVSAYDFDRLRYILLSSKGPDHSLQEDQVRLVARQHRIFLWVRVALPMLLATVFFGVAVGGNIVIKLPAVLRRGFTVTQTGTQAVPAKPSTTFRAPETITIFWWLPVLVGLLCVVVAMGLWLNWKYNFLMVTDWYVCLVTVPPVWLPMWQSRFPRLSYEEMDTGGNRNTFLGNFVGKLLGVGWGAVQLDSPSQHDARFNDIPGLPNHRLIVQIIESARRSYRRPVMLASQ